MTELLASFESLPFIGQIAIGALMLGAVFALGSMFTIRFPPPGLGL